VTPPAARPRPTTSTPHRPVCRRGRAPRRSSTGLTPTTDLVTVGIGGNDAGFAGAATDCLSPLPEGAQCKEKYTAGGTDQLAAQIDASEAKLVRALQEIHSRSPKARILMVDYLAGIPEIGCYPIVPMSNSDMAYLYVTPEAQRDGEERGCGRRRGVRGHLHPSIGAAVAVPAHPNSAGAASQYCSTLAAVEARS